MSQRILGTSEPRHRPEQVSNSSWYLYLGARSGTSGWPASQLWSLHKHFDSKITLKRRSYIFHDIAQTSEFTGCTYIIYVHSKGFFSVAGGGVSGGLANKVFTEIVPSTAPILLSTKFDLNLIMQFMVLSMNLAYRIRIS